jgi:hypothetical protein
VFVELDRAASVRAPAGAESEQQKPCTQARSCALHGIASCRY